MTSDTTTTEHEWTFIGQRLDRKGKAAFAWLGDTGEERWYSKAVAPSACVGAVYRIHRTAEGAALIGGPQAPRYLRMSDDPRLPAWRAEHEHTKTRIEAARPQARRRRAPGRPGLPDPCRGRRVVSWSRLTRSEGRRARRPHPLHSVRPVAGSP